MTKKMNGSSFSRRRMMQASAAIGAGTVAGSAFPAWRARAAEGHVFGSHTWDHATDEVEAGLRRALRERELAIRP